MLWLVAQSCPTLYDTLDCSPPGSSVHGDSPGKNTGVSCHFLLQGIFPTQGSNKPSSTHPAGRFFTDGATREAQEYRSRLGTYTEISVLTLAPWKKSYANLDSILKSTYIILLTKVCVVKAMVYSVFLCGCESRTIKKASVQFSSVQLLSRVRLFVTP